MKIIFNIRYRTNWGESVYLVGDIDALGNGDCTKAIKMNLRGNDRWSAEVTVPPVEGGFGYHYFVLNDDGTKRNEWGHGDRFTACEEGTYRIYDRWQDQPFDKPYYSSLFTDCVYRQNYTDKGVVPTRGFVLVEVSAPMIGGDNVLAISGNCASLGEWDSDSRHKTVEFYIPQLAGTRSPKESKPIPSLNSLSSTALRVRS